MKEQNSTAPVGSSDLFGRVERITRHASLSKVNAEIVNGRCIILGVLLGGMISALLLVTRRVTLHTAIPYGPFLILGGLVAMLWGPAIVKWWLRM